MAREGGPSGRWSSRARVIAHDFLEADSRWLALFRITFGCVLLGHLIVLACFGRIDAYFTDAGMMPVETLRELTPPHHAATLFRFVHSHAEAVAMFVASGVVYACFTLGLFTRLSSLLAFVATVSLHHRIPFVVNGAMVTMHLLILWSMFLPLGRHASVDAWLAARRGDDRVPIRVRSFAMLALRLQLVVIYVFNVLHKGGPTWKGGAAVHYVLWQSRAVLPAGIFLREHEPSWFSPLATYGTYVVESAIALLVLSPFLRVASRRLAAVLIVAFHGGIALLLDLGPFPFVFACAALFLLASEDGRPIGRWIGGVAEAVPEAELAADPRSRRLRSLREATLVALGLHAALMTWTGNPALRMTFGAPTRLPIVAEIGDVLYVWQMWHLFSPDAPTDDIALMPVVTLADGRSLDVRRHAVPDFELLDGRARPIDYLTQTLDLALTKSRSPTRWESYARYVARVPTLERWPGERRVNEVTVHVLTVPRPAFGERQSEVIFSRVAFTKRFAPREMAGRFGD